MSGIMGEVKILCPASNRYVETGIVMEHDVFLLIDVTDATITCKACGNRHVWRSDEHAWEMLKTTAAAPEDAALPET